MDRRGRGGAAPAATAQPSRDGGILRRLARHVASPPGLTATVHWFFLIFGEGVLIASAVPLVVLIRNRAPAWLEWLAVLAVMTTAAVWYRSYRRDRYGGWDSIVDSLTVFLVALTLGTAFVGTGILFARGQLRSLYGSLRGKLLHMAIGYVCLAVGLWWSTAAADAAVLRLLVAAPVLFTSTLMVHALSIRLGRYEWAFQRERVLAWVGREFAGRIGRRRVGEVTIAATADLFGTAMPAVVAVGPADRLEVVAATPDLAPAIGVVLAVDGARVRLAEPTRTQTQAQAQAIAPVVGREPCAVLALPIAARDELHGVLVLVLDALAPVEPALRAALESLCGSAALALVNAALDAKLTSMAFHDSLTRLPNRALLAEQTDTALARAARSGSMVALLVLDLNGFKQINDQLGHRAGDETLRIVGARLRDQLRHGDVAARLGGDEFAVLLTDLTGPAEAATVARRIIRSLGKPLRLGGQHQARVGVSVGIVTWSAPPSPQGVERAKQGSVPGLDGLLHDADTAMYLAKRRGAGYEMVSGQRRNR